MASGIWLAQAIEEMYPAAMSWIHHPSGAAKQALFQAYAALPPRAKQAYDADVERAFRAEHGSKAVVYRYRIRGDSSGASVSPVEPAYLNPGLYKAYEMNPGDALVHYAQDEMPLGGRAFGHEKEIILRPGTQLKEIKAAYSYDRRIATRAIRIPRDQIKHAVERELVPQIRRWLEQHPHQDRPIGGSDRVIAEASLYVDSVDGKESIRCDIFVTSEAARNKGYPVLLGRTGKRKFKDGEAYCKIIASINGAISPAEYLNESSGTDLKSYRHVYFEPLGECTSERCLPYGLYSLLTHEVTHVAEAAMPYYGVTYKTDESGHTLDEKQYVNDPLEVRAFMQQIVEDTVRSGLKLKEHVTDSRRLIDLALRMSTTWSAIEKNLNQRSKKLILSAVYQAFSENGLV